MATRTGAIALSFLLLAGLAEAGPMTASAHAVLDRQAVSASELGETARHRPMMDLLELPVELQLHRLPLPTMNDEQQTIDMRMDDQLPESLSLRYRANAVLTVYVSADLNAELPRLDALDGDTYFTTGMEAAITPRLRFFLEDFQPASMVTGGGVDPETLAKEPTPLRSWDGHQVTIGFRYTTPLGARIDLELEAGAVFSVLSVSSRRSSVGALGSLTIKF